MVPEGPARRFRAGQGYLEDPCKGARADRVARGARGDMQPAAMDRQDTADSEDTKGTEAPAA